MQHTGKNLHWYGFLLSLSIQYHSDNIHKINYSNNKDKLSIKQRYKEKYIQAERQTHIKGSARDRKKLPLILNNRNLHKLCLFIKISVSGHIFITLNYRTVM